VDGPSGGQSVRNPGVRSGPGLLSLSREDPTSGSGRGGKRVLRIIAGERRGHKFDGPKDRETRPTSDLVRESLFNILRDEVEGKDVLDLFAGTGALGLEALSRGASRAVFIERDRENAALIRRNLATLRFEDRGMVQTADAFRWVRTFVPINDTPLVVFLDPPYHLYLDRPGRIGELIADLLTRLPAESVVVVESGQPFVGEILPDLDSWDLRRYGGTHVAIRTVGDGEETDSGRPIPEESDHDD
jgi:16S rRNA (guanine966-N2)-methyltransferase